MKEPMGEVIAKDDVCRSWWREQDMYNPIVFDGDLYWWGPVEYCAHVDDEEADDDDDDDLNDGADEWRRSWWSDWYRVWVAGWHGPWCDRHATKRRSPHVTWSVCLIVMMMMINIGMGGYLDQADRVLYLFPWMVMVLVIRRVRCAVRVMVGSREVRGP